MDFTKTDGILFDLDGTLWDSRDGVLKAWNEVISLHPEVERGPLTREEILPCFGLPMNEIRDRLLKDAAPEARERVMEAMCAHENEYLLAHGGILFPDLEDTLAYLAARFPLFIVSNCQDGYIQAFLGAHRLGKYFKDTECWGRTHVGKDGSIRILEDRNHLKQAVYIGDTAGDEKSARKAGLPFIFAAYGFGKAAAPDAVIARVSSLKELFGKDDMT
ncbi:MAG: HAD family hydrolase [Lachnospiraceae bacterium]|jgi:phosphoglycolate phosphatase|nr:HAD family hydrolase [Lachnospiraceae bacterium]MCH4030355.1 HAD family hydrolase [Lachnospiraceae bacterium]MCH4069567.1 HAD family hydrolase [Lachnospiraceae bacterium]MCH4107497.1 HAD family hydrolase [Lachnospiraceae bacterium]MCI1301652.1 HAD family hydrolase [Lachnospiraceae bacterium]